MADTPAYLRHHVDERDVTVDWFFGDRPFRRRIGQLVLVVLGWFAAVLPVVVTVSAITHRDDGGGWWSYHEGFVMFAVTMRYLAFLLVFFVVAYLVLYLLNQAVVRRSAGQRTYDEQRLAERSAIADELYTHKYGPQSLRRRQGRVRIEPYGDFETYELRDQYRARGVD